MKGPIYMMRMVATGGRILANDTCKETVIIWKENGEYMVKKVKYKLPFDWYFIFYHVVDNHNNRRHTLPSIGDICRTDWCECWVFAFILAI